MKKTAQKIRDIFVAGLIFLLPLVVLIVLLTKIFQYLTGFTTRIAALFGLKSFIGISGGTIISAISLIIFCMLCGYLVRVSFFKSVSRWLDKKMMAHIPGYSVYREMALSKLEPKDEVLPYESAAWINVNEVQQPGFLMETMPDGRLVVFMPVAGNTKEGTVWVLPADKVTVGRHTDMKAFRTAVNNLGVGLGKIQKDFTVK